MSRRRLDQWAAAMRGSLRSFSGKPRTAPRSRPVRLEQLESRRLMAITVTSLGDDPGGVEAGVSLREAIIQASPGETIDFAVHGTIELDNELFIDKSLTISGPGSALLTIKANGGNEESAGDGNRIFTIDSGSLADKSVTISKLRLAGGDASGDGGAIFNRENLTIDDCVITDNFSSAGTHGGGAIFNEAGALTVVSSVISGNQTSGAGGGGIFNLGGGLAITNTFIRSNTAETGSGGGAYSTGGNVEITSSTIAFNSAQKGGGIHLQGGKLSMFNATVSGNAATADGGGVWLETSANEESRFIHTTIADNRSDTNDDSTGDGGGIFVAGSEVPELNHTIVAGNYKGSVGVQPADVVGSWSGDFYLVNQDALLGPLNYNGGVVPTHALLPNSPAIDAGDPNAVPGVAPIPLEDARGVGFTRVFDGNGTDGPQIDIGAFELQTDSMAMTLVVDTLVDEDDGNYAAGDLSLREAIVLANRNHGVEDTITFDTALAGGTINLTRGELAITDSLAILGLGSTLLTIDASGSDLSALAGDGARIFNVDDGNPNHDSVVTIQGLKLVGGDTYSGGGAIRNSEDLTVSECEISGNSAVADGGGILSIKGELIVVDSIISGNSTHKDYATYGGGGGIATFSYLKLASSAVFGNMSAGHGGGIFAADGMLNVTNSTISGNSSGVGGASSHQEGGGIFIGKDAGPSGDDVRISHSTITGNNSPGSGAGIFVDTSVEATFSVHNSIVAGNTGSNPNSNTNSHGLNIVYSRVGGDPMLSPLGFHGGRTPTHAPLAGSSAIDGGDDSLQAGIGDVPLFDQRGVFHSRVFGAAIDVGAHETQPQALAGDVNGDRVVDAADYTVWRNNFGQTVGVYTRGDLDGNGFVDQFDYAIWKSNFGNLLEGAGAGGLARTSSAATGGGAGSTAVETSAGKVVLYSASSVQFVEPAAAELDGYSTLAAPVDAGIARAWATLPESRGRETVVRDARERRSRAEVIAPHVRDLLLACIGVEERRADRQWQTDDADDLSASARAEFAAVDSAIDSFALNTGPPGPFGPRYRLRL